MCFGSSIQKTILLKRFKFILTIYNYASIFTYFYSKERKSKFMFYFMYIIYDDKLNTNKKQQKHTKKGGRKTRLSLRSLFCI